MNRTSWETNNVNNHDSRIDYNNFLLTADLFLNDTLTEVNHVINNDYQSLFSSSTILPGSIGNYSRTNTSIILNVIHPISGITSSIEKVILTFLMSIMAFLTVSGNLLVIIAFISDTTIRTYSNYFILNLSIADLLIGLICIPLYAHKLILGEWYLGYHLCKIWLVFDYVVGSASTLCIVVISYDRYQMVSKGLNYISSTTIRRALIFVFGTWFIAILNYGPAIVLWDLLPGSPPFIYTECDPPFAKNFPYLVTTAFVEFFVPFFSLSTLNLLVYLNIRQRSRGLIRTTDKNLISTLTLATLESAKPLVNLTANGHDKDHHHHHVENIPLHVSVPIPSTTTYAKSSSSLALARDRKAAKSLFILVFAFVICWCPYTLLTLIRALCKQSDKCVPVLIYEITFWLLWLNSTINPLLYSFLHVKFRNTFYRILCFYTVRHRRRLRTH